MAAQFGVTWNHLWYLAYLWVYTLLLLALLPVLESAAGIGSADWLRAARAGWPLLVLPVAGPGSPHLLLANAAFPGNHALLDDWYLHAEYFTVFLSGYLVVRGTIWDTLGASCAASAGRRAGVDRGRTALAGHLDPFRWRRRVPAACSGALTASNALARALYTWSAPCWPIFGWGIVLLDRPFRWLPYATEAVYPWYILHQSVIVALAFC